MWRCQTLRGKFADLIVDFYASHFYAPKFRLFAGILPSIYWSETIIWTAESALALAVRNTTKGYRVRMACVWFTAAEAAAVAFLSSSLSHFMVAFWPQAGIRAKAKINLWMIMSAAENYPPEKSPIDAAATAVNDAPWTLNSLQPGSRQRPETGSLTIDGCGAIKMYLAPKWVALGFVHRRRSLRVRFEWVILCRICSWNRKDFNERGVNFRTQVCWEAYSFFLPPSSSSNFVPSDVCAPRQSKSPTLIGKWAIMDSFLFAPGDSSRAGCRPFSWRPKFGIYFRYGKHISITQGTNGTFFLLCSA